MVWGMEHYGGCSSELSIGGCEVERLWLAGESVEEVLGMSVGMVCGNGVLWLPTAEDGVQGVVFSFIHGFPFVHC